MQSRPRSDGESRKNPRYRGRSIRPDSTPIPKQPASARIEEQRLREQLRALQLQFELLDGRRWLWRLNALLDRFPDLKKDFALPDSPERPHSETTIAVASYEYKSLPNKGNKPIFKRAWRDVEGAGAERFQHIHWHGPLDFLAAVAWYADMNARLEFGSLQSQVEALEQSRGQPWAYVGVAPAREERLRSLPTKGHGSRRTIPKQQAPMYAKKRNIDEVLHDPNIS